MKKLIAIIFVLAIALSTNASSGRVVYINDKAGVLTSDGGIEYGAISSSDNFLAVDSNTVFYLDMTSTTTTETSTSGTGFANNTWALTGTNSGQSTTITMDGVSKTKRVRIFSGSSNYLQNSDSKIIVGNYGTITLEAIISPDDFSDNANFWGNFGSGTNNGIQTYFATSIGCQLNNFVGGGNNFSGSPLTFTPTPSGKWLHIAMTFDSGTNERKIAWKYEGLITSMTTAGVGNTNLLTDASSDDNYTDSGLVNFLIGHGSGTQLGTANAGFDGRISEVRLSNIVRY